MFYWNIMFWPKNISAQKVLIEWQKNLTRQGPLNTCLVSHQIFLVREILTFLWLSYQVYLTISPFPRFLSPIPVNQIFPSKPALLDAHSQPCRKKLPVFPPKVFLMYQVFCTYENGNSTHKLGSVFASGLNFYILTKTNVARKAYRIISSFS